LLPNCANLIRRKEAVLLAIDCDCIEAESTRIFEAKHDFMALGTAEVGCGGNADVLAIYGEA
jgi:hypothetical protein